MTAPALEVRDVRARYGSVEALHGVDVVVGRGRLVALLGGNGAGKTTLLRAISGVVSQTGAVLLDGEPVGGRPAAAIARAGIGHVPEGRGTFTDLTVAENLRLGLLARRPDLRSKADADLDLVYATFPVLRDMRGRVAGLLSGGQQQMLALGRALLARPKVLLIDEPSLGLAPMLTRDLFATFDTVRADWDTSILLAEQNASLSLSVADDVVVMAGGVVALSGPVEHFRDGAAIRDVYLGNHDPKAGTDR
jgi:branched-chain amino acid transport system ATP-binding protein